MNGKVCTCNSIAFLPVMIWPVALIWCVPVVKMSVEDITKLVAPNRKFDLLVVGLQEAPKCDVSQVLQETMADTHM
jgi:hypothetical protein